MSKTTVDAPKTDLLFAKAEGEFAQWEVVKDLVDESIDLMLNYRQSGHPGGSRSKVHALLSTMLSGAMRFDLIRPWRTYGDRFVLSAGHTVPLVYATLATLNQIAKERARAGEARGGVGSASVGSALPPAATRVGGPARHRSRFRSGANA